MTHHVPGLEAAGVRSHLTLRYSAKLDLSCPENKRIIFFGTIILATLNTEKRKLPKDATMVRTVCPQNG